MQKHFFFLEKRKPVLKEKTSFFLRKGLKKVLFYAFTLLLCFSRVPSHIFLPFLALDIPP